MKTKILSLILAVSVLMAVFTSCSGKNDDTPKGMYRIGGEANSYHLYVPTTWTEKSATGFTSAACQDKSNISMQVLSVKGIFTNGADGYAIMTNSNTYYEINDYFTKEYFPYLTATFSNVELKESFTTNQTLGGCKHTAKYVYTITRDEVREETQKENEEGKVLVAKQEYTIMQIFAAYDSSIYIFTYTATTENYNLHLEEVNLIIENFKF